jgi:hypothetical protein
MYKPNFYNNSVLKKLKQLTSDDIHSFREKGGVLQPRSITSSQRIESDVRVSGEEAPQDEIEGVYVALDCFPTRQDIIQPKKYNMTMTAYNYSY